MGLLKGQEPVCLFVFFEFFGSCFFFQPFCERNPTKENIDRLENRSAIFACTAQIPPPKEQKINGKKKMEKNKRTHHFS